MLEEASDLFQLRPGFEPDGAAPAAQPRGSPPRPRRRCARPCHRLGPLFRPRRPLQARGGPGGGSVWRSPAARTWSTLTSASWRARSSSSSGASTRRRSRRREVQPLRPPDRRAPGAGGVRARQLPRGDGGHHRLVCCSPTARDKGRELIDPRGLKTVRALGRGVGRAVPRPPRTGCGTAFDRLELHRERFRDRGLRRWRRSASGGRGSQSGRIEVAVRLREFEIWSRLDDEQVFHLTQSADEERRKGSKIFEFGADEADIYVLEKGRISIRRPTSYGTFELGILEPRSSARSSTSSPAGAGQRGDRSLGALRRRRARGADQRVARSRDRDLSELLARACDELRGANEQLRTSSPRSAAPRSS